jgi:hypothetical protein
MRLIATRLLEREAIGSGSTNEATLKTLSARHVLDRQQRNTHSAVAAIAAVMDARVTGAGGGTR